MAPCASPSPRWPPSHGSNSVPELAVVRLPLGFRLRRVQWPRRRGANREGKSRVCQASGSKSSGQKPDASICSETSANVSADSRFVRLELRYVFLLFCFKGNKIFGLKKNTIRLPANDHHCCNGCESNHVMPR